MTYIYQASIEVEPGSMAQSDIAACLKSLLCHTRLNIYDGDDGETSCNIIDSHVSLVSMPLVRQSNNTTTQKSEKE